MYTQVCNATHHHILFCVILSTLCTFCLHHIDNQSVTQCRQPQFISALTSAHLAHSCYCRETCVLVTGGCIFGYGRANFHSLRPEICSPYVMTRPWCGRHMRRSGHTQCTCASNGAKLKVCNLFKHALCIHVCRLYQPQTTLTKCLIISAVHVKSAECRQNCAKIDDRVELHAAKCAHVCKLRQNKLANLNTLLYIYITNRTQATFIKAAGA